MTSCTASEAPAGRDALLREKLANLLSIPEAQRDADCRRQIRSMQALKSLSVLLQQPAAAPDVSSGWLCRYATASGHVQLRKRRCCAWQPLRAALRTLQSQQHAEQPHYGERSATKLVGIAVTCSSASSNAACTLLRQSDDEPSRLVAAQWHGFGCLLVSAAHQLQTIAQVNSCKRLLIRLWAAQRERWGHLLALHSSSSDLSSYHGSRQQTLTSRTCQWLVPFRMCPVHQAITPLLHPLLIHDGICVLDT